MHARQKAESTRTNRAPNSNSNLNSSRQCLRYDATADLPSSECSIYITKYISVESRQQTTQNSIYAPVSFALISAIPFSDTRIIDLTETNSGQKQTNTKIFFDNTYQRLCEHRSLPECHSIHLSVGFFFVFQRQPQMNRNNTNQRK